MESVTSTVDKKKMLGKDNFVSEQQICIEVMTNCLFCMHQALQRPRFPSV